MKQNLFKASKTVLLGTLFAANTLMISNSMAQQSENIKANTMTDKQRADGMKYLEKILPYIINVQKHAVSSNTQQNPQISSQDFEDELDTTLLQPDEVMPEILQSLEIINDSTSTDVQRDDGIKRFNKAMPFLIQAGMNEQPSETKNLFKSSSLDFKDDRNVQQVDSTANPLRPKVP